MQMKEGVSKLLDLLQRNKRTPIKAAILIFCLFVENKDFLSNLCLKIWNCSCVRNYLSCMGLCSSAD